MSKLTEGLSKEEKKLLKKMVWRDFQVGTNYNHVRQMGHGCAHVMRKFIEWLYPGKENREKRVEAMKRESVFYNITPYINTLGIGLFASMEKEAKENPKFDTRAINNVKIAIMGPASGIGDSLYWVTLRVIAASIAIPFGLQGSFLGMLVFLAIFGIVHYPGLYYLMFMSYKLGSSFVSKAFASGILPMVTRAAAIVGMIMIGTMISNNVNVPIALAINVGETNMTIASILDGIMPGMLGLLLTFGCFKAVRKKINPNWIMLIVFAVGILGAMIGIF